MMVRKTLTELFDDYMLESEFARRLRPSTLRGSREAFRLLLKLTPDITLATLSPSTIIRFFKALEERKRLRGNTQEVSGIKKSTARTYWSKLHSFFEWLRIQKHIAENPLRDMRRPTVTWDNLKFLSKLQVEKIFAAIHASPNPNILLMKRNLAMFYVLLFCGLRREELLTLYLRDIDFERRTLTVRAENSKIPRTRVVPLHSKVILHLKDYLKERRTYSTPYLFVARTRDTRISNDGLNQLVATLKKRSKTNFHLHQFRHTFAVNFLKSSNNVVKLKQLLGHTDIKMTLVYLRCLPTEELRGDIENMRLEDFV